MICWYIVLAVLKVLDVLIPPNGRGLNGCRAARINTDRKINVQLTMNNVQFYLKKINSVHGPGIFFVPLGLLGVVGNHMLLISRSLGAV